MAGREKDDFPGHLAAHVGEAHLQVRQQGEGRSVESYCIHPGDVRQGEEVAGGGAERQLGQLHCEGTDVSFSVDVDSLACIDNNRVLCILSASGNERTICRMKAVLQSNAKVQMW